MIVHLQHALVKLIIGKEKFKNWIIVYIKQL